MASAAIGIGLNFVVGRIQASRAKKAAKKNAGTQFERDYGENVSRKVACGYVGVAGHDVYVNTYGNSNKYLQQVYCLSDYPCDGLSRVWAGGEELTLLLIDSSSAHQSYSVASGKYSGRMQFTFYNGTQAGADPSLVTYANPSGRWTAQHFGSGACYLVAFVTYDQEEMNSFPQFFFEIRGARLYDPRKDFTVGGSGAHRWGDYSTYEFTENPIIMDYNYRRGFSWNGDMFCGMGMSPEDLPVDKYATAANICDELVSGERRYRCSVLLDCDVDHGDNIDGLMQACGGMVIDSVDGSWPLIGTAQPIVATLTDDDLIVGENVRFQRRRSMADLVNSVGGTYPEPSNMWSPTGYDTQTNSSQVALDRRTRDLAINFPTVPSKRQANQLAAIYYKENRFEATADVVLRPYFQDVRVGDWVRWNSERYGDRAYIVQSRSIRALTSDGPRNVALSLQERDSSIYAGTGVLPPVVPIPSGEPVYLNELPDWTPIPILAQADDGRTIAAFRMSWSPFDDVSVTGIQFEWWPTAEPNNRYTKNVQPDVTITMLQEGIVSETEYSFRHKLIANRPTVWSPVKKATSLPSGNADLEVYLDNLNKEVKEQFQKLFQGFDDVRPILERILTDQQLQGATSEVIRRGLTKQIGDARARFTEEISVVVSNLAAAVTSITELDAEFESNKATVTQELASVATDLDALATQITDVYAAIDDGFAQGRVEFRAAANQSGVDARFSVALRGSVNDTFKESGFFLELYTVGGVQHSRFAVMADQFVVTNGNVSTLPLVYEDGILKLQNVQVSWATIQNAVINNAVFGTTNLDYNSVTSSDSFSGSGSRDILAPHGWLTIATRTINNPNPTAVFAYIVGSYSGLLGPNSSGTFGMRLINATTGEVIFIDTFSFSTGGSTESVSRSVSATAIGKGDVRGNNVYHIQTYKQPGGIPSSSFNVNLLWWKR
ncbi:hypothetical protein ABID21_001936 [Pseudorhizobium tarimense]|uniref:Phage tail protein n=1 Tax=Pseudorhizobium tarimense TaxID=1079109 RepID=A0ABV2H5Y0_9HYPH|nr:phage tail protein [Pseudorhizobium tarimense]MCJ8519028.1 phage tail protein [Pseudorhizobium tarimense]